MSETRKIAAILVADVVGYSRLADADEERTLARLRALRTMTAMARTLVLPEATPVGALSALCGLLGHVRLALIHTSWTTSSPARAICASWSIAIPYPACSRPTTASASGEVHRGPLEIGEGAVVEGAFVRSPQDHAGRLARLERFLPARRTQAPAVPGP
jgi:hypothetical protein